MNAKKEGKSDECKEDDKEIAKALRNRDRALRELVETEKTYVNGLGKLIIIYMNPLKQNDYKIISISDHYTIFPSVVSTIYNLHNQLLAELDYNYYHFNDTDESITSRIGKVLIKYVELFKMYQIYMNGYERTTKALQLLRKKNKKFNRWLQSQFVKTEIAAGDLENLLILPIQRIPRYQLLIAEIIKQTEKICIYHNDLDDLRNTYTQISDITKLIETKMKQYDNKRKVALIEKKFSNISAGDLVEPSRYYMTESNINNPHERIRIHNSDASSYNIQLFLFNDCLIYGHIPAEESVSINHIINHSNPKLYFNHSLIFDSLFKCVIENNYMYNHKKLHCLKIYSRHYSIWISFKTKKLRSKWLKLINNANDLVNNKHIKNLQRFNQNKLENDQENENNNQNNNNKEQQMLAYPCFVPDDYTNFCQQCNVKFTYISNRKHHCKQCGRLLCKTCTNYRINSIFLNKNKKNKIVRCCKKCKHANTFSILSSTNKSNSILINHNINTIQRRQYPKYEAKYDHGYNRHMQIYNKLNKPLHRSNRTNSTPSLKSPPLRPKQFTSTQPHVPQLQKRKSTPLLINASCTSTYIKSPKMRAIKTKTRGCINIRAPFNTSKSLKTVRMDKCENNTNNFLIQEEDSLSFNDEIDDDYKSVSMDMEMDMDIDMDMPVLDISEKKQIKKINARMRQTPRRSRSYAIGLLNECNLPQTYVGVGCVITDEDTTDDNTFIDQLLLSSSDAPSSNESKKESPFVKKEKVHRHSSFRKNNYSTHITSKSLNWLSLD